jgi:hypothetical protein
MNRGNMAAEDNNEAFTQAQAIVKKSFQEIHERYKLVLSIYQKEHKTITRI